MMSASAMIPTASIRSARPSARSARSVASSTRSLNQYARASWCSMSARAGSIGEVGERLRRRLEELDGGAGVPGVDHPPPERGRRACGARAVAERQASLDGVAQRRRSANSIRPALTRRHTGLLHQVCDLGRVVRDLDRLGEEHHRLVVAPERAGARGRGSERDPRLRGERPAVRVVRRGAERVEVVRREGARQLVLAERLEVARRRQVARPSVAPGERLVGDLADERLDERVLAALGRARDPGRGRAARGGRGTGRSRRPGRARGCSPPRAPSSVKLWPSTAASWITDRSVAGSSASSRAAMSAWSVSGTARSVRSPAGA